MALGATDHIWTIGEPVNAPLTEIDGPEQGSHCGRFTAIEDGRV